MDRINDVFSSRLKRAMTEKGADNKSVATAAETSAQNFSNYLTGKNMPSCDKLVMLANALNVSVDFLLGNDGALHAKREFSSADMLRDLVLIADGLNMDVSKQSESSFAIVASPLDKTKSIPEEHDACNIISFFDSWIKYRELLSGHHITKDEYDALVESCILRNIV